MSNSCLPDAAGSREISWLGELPGDGPIREASIRLTDDRLADLILGYDTA